MVKNKLKWLGHVERRLVYVVVRKINHIEESQINKGRRRPKKATRETISKNLEINDLDQNKVYDKTL